MRAVTPDVMRRINAGLALRALIGRDELVTVDQLVDLTQLSRRTLDLIRDQLIGEGWLVEVDSRLSESGTGRPKRYFQFRPDNALLVGVWIDGFAVSCVVADIEGHVLGRGQVPLEDYDDPTRSLRQAADCIAQAVTASGRPRSRLRAATLAVSGLVHENGTVLRVINRPAWAGVNAREALSGLLGMPVFTDNDANLAALGEHWLGAARDQHTFIWLTAGNRSGSGIVIRGQIHHGVDGAAGELVYSQRFGLQELELHPVGMLTSPVPEQSAQAAELFKRGRVTQLRSSGILAEFVEPVTSVLVALAWTIAPPLIVLGGGLEAGGQVLLKELRKRLADFSTPRLELRMAQLGRDSRLLGGVKLGFDRMNEDILGPTRGTGTAGA
jgi:predicted NBD/HSP70 family sugar kinase